jgi:hypothetical protein
MSTTSEMFGLPKNEFHRKPGPIDILIGINYPTFHADENKAVRMGDILSEVPAFTS